MLRLCIAACSAGIAITIDAEEAERLELSIAVFAYLFGHASLRAWAGLGLAVQAYQKRALPLLQYLNGLAEAQQRLLPLRLVKGAYWDMEIKRAQEQGLADYPVFTLKHHTDVSYLACARYLLTQCPFIYPQFATHNAHTVSYIHHHADGREFEFQRLHGMGEDLYAHVTNPQGLNVPCRVYAPVGAHEDLLPYLVRRLLENGANVSFINRIADRGVALSELVADPVAAVTPANQTTRHPRIPTPPDLFRPQRQNSRGLNFAERTQQALLLDSLSRARSIEWTAAPLVNGQSLRGKSRSVYNPAHTRIRSGRVWDATTGVASQALAICAEAFPSWRNTTAHYRAALLDKAADLMQERLPELAAQCVLEAGKCLRDAHDEVREAVDFLRYYAACSRTLMGAETALPGPAGESNSLRLCGRGVFVCISPWNFPVAIFTGQIAAALAAGNTVIAKPAEQATLVAFQVAELQEELFGPVLHVLRYDAAELAPLLEQINALGYGLTLGIQSRIEQRAHYIRERVRVGNIYVNRNMVGAVVGVQPFGGCGLSGTGPKAGGPHYLLRFATEQTCTINTAAIGGNAALLTL